MCSRNTWLDEQIDEIIELYTEETQSMREIAEVFDVTAPTIRKRLVENNVSIRNGGSQYTLLKDKRTEIVDRYVEQEESLQTIAEGYGTSINGIVRQLRTADIDLERSGPEPTDLGFSPYQVSVIEGELLGDGCLYQRESGSCFFQFTNTAKEHTVRVKEKLPKGLFPEDQPYSVTRTAGFGEEKYTSWIVSSRVQPLFLEKYSDWYEEYDGKHRKVVPAGYTLDKTALLHWYWGDGNCSIRDRGAPRICFATHGFPETSVEHLQGELERLGYDNYTVPQDGVKNGSGLLIRLNDRASRLFLSDLRPRNLLGAYDYKFPVSDE